METKTRWYCGKIVNSTVLEAFASRVTPNHETHNEMYSSVIGPFRTKRAAKWAERFGFNNPHFQHVNDAERLSRIACQL